MKEILHQLKTVVFPFFLGFQPSFWWRRISQPSTVSYYVCNANYHKETIRKPFETFG